MENNNIPTDYGRDFTPPDNPDFSIDVNENTALRKLIRDGLLRAAEKDSQKIPMIYCRPRWLDEGIICLWAKDLNKYLKRQCKEMSGELIDAFNILDESLTQKLEEEDNSSTDK